MSFDYRVGFFRIKLPQAVGDKQSSAVPGLKVKIECLVSLGASYGNT